MDGPDSSANVTELFDLVRFALTDSFGTTRTAILFRRISSGLKQDYPQFTQFLIDRIETGYHYRLPAAWDDGFTDESVSSFRELIRVLLPALVEAGSMEAAIRIVNIEELRRNEILDAESEKQWRSSEKEG